MATLVLALNLCGLPRRAWAAPTQALTQNFTALRTDIAPPWVPDPDNRGTWSLLYSCVFTLVLCVWTAIHLNVPSYHESQLSQWLRKLKWVVLAVIAPELGVYVACEQYLHAKELIGELAEKSVKNGSQGPYRIDQSETQLPQKSEKSDPEKAASKRRVFSLIYGYFAIMGGLAVDVSDIDDRLHSVTLTPAGLKHLAERGHFIEISDGDIRDKSKADIFAKCLVILQVTWIALQTISRKAAGYSLSTLEIHTLVHAACASVMYILWFRKPLDVQAPTIVSKAGFEDSIAMMLMQTPGVGASWYSHLDPPKDFEPAIAGPRSEASFLMFDNTALSRRSDGCPSCGGYSTPSTTTNTEVADKGVFPAIPKTCDGCVNLSNLGPQQARNLGARTLSLQTTAHPPSGIRCGPPPGVRAVCELRSGDFTRDGIGLQPLITFSSYHDRYIPLPWWCCFLRFLHPCPPEPTWPVQISPTLKERLPPTTLLQWPAYWHEIKLSLSEKDLKRWKLAHAYFVSRGVNAKSKHYPNLDQHYKNFPFSWFVSKPITRRSRNVNFLYPQSDSDWSTLVWTLWFLCSLYGGVHLALWNYEFPTRVESRLWRISAVALGSAPILLLLLGWSQSRSYDYVKRFIRKFRFIKRDWEINLDGIRYGLILMGGAAALFYTFARIYIVVESFISLRHVPMGVYEGGLGWSKYIPHL